MAPYPTAAAAGTANAGQRPAGPRAVVAGQVPVIVAAEDNPDIDIRHVPDFLRHLLERSTPGGICISRPAPPSTRSTTAARVERGLEGGDCRGRAAVAQPAGGHRQPPQHCPRIRGSASRGCFCRASSWSRARRGRPTADGRPRRRALLRPLQSQRPHQRLPAGGYR